MKLSLNWIREYVDLPADLPAERLAYELTMRTVEVEEVVSLADGLADVVVGRITDVQPHPDADRLRVCAVEIGDQSVAIVCGGSNLSVGQSVAVALPGARVRWHGEGEPVEIQITRLRGVRSHGMICAAAELGLEGLFPADDDHVILDVSAWQAVPGTPLSNALSLDDLILEIDNKSLTNRPDLWCHYGMARELAAIFRRELRPLPDFAPPAHEPGPAIAIEAPDRCGRYAAMVYTGLAVQPSPYWLRQMLWKVDVRPINNLVDLTNYVMLATGQPTHGFDRQHVRGGIVVRTARPDETLGLLDGQQLDLTGNDLLICDAQGPMALAGIMGGKQESIVDDTTEMILELAQFAPLSVRRSAQRFGLRTESSARNEKGIDAERMDQAMAVADHLLRRLLPTARLAGVSDCRPVRAEYPVIDVPMSFLNSRLGRVIQREEVVALLAPLGFDVAARGEVLQVRVPSWRGTGDVSLADDVLEEVARMIGYDAFAFIPPRVRLERAIRQRGPEADRAIREYLSFHAGMQEVFTYPWVPQRYLEAAGIDPAACLRLSAPPAPDAAHLRPSLVPGLLESIVVNQRHFDSFRVYEFTQVFAPGASHPSDANETLPSQERRVGGAVVGTDPLRLFREAKGVLEALPRMAMLAPFAFEQREKPAWADPKVWLNVVDGEAVIGSLGILSAQAASHAGIKRLHTALFELSADQLQPLPSRENRFQPLPTFPLVELDLSVVLEEDVAWSELERLILEVARRCAFVEEYRGQQIPAGKKSVMFRYWLESDAGTWTAEQIDAETARLLHRIRQVLGGELRKI